MVTLAHKRGGMEGTVVLAIVRGELGNTLLIGNYRMGRQPIERDTGAMISSVSFRATA